MAISLDTGLGASAFAGGYPSAATPAAAGASPQGPRTIGAKAFGITTGGGGGGPATAGPGSPGVAAVSFLVLVYIWWALPR
jgi:hypothetical protein